MTACGVVQSARVVRYPDGRSKGWGLVTFADPAGAAEAIANYNDIELMGRKIFIREDREQEGAGGGGGFVGGGFVGGDGGDGGQP